ncbi:MAG: cohesin domain-containing protein [bacterium]
MKEKKVWSLIALVWLLFSCQGGGGGVPTTPQAAGTVSLVPSSSGPLAQGQTFMVKILIDRIPQVFQASIRLSYDASALNLQSFQPGGFLQKATDPPRCVGLLSAAKALPTRNVLIISASRKGRSCGNTDQVSGEFGTLVFTTRRAVVDATGLVAFLSDPRWIQFRDAQGRKFPVGEVNPALTRLQLLPD